MFVRPVVLMVVRALFEVGQNPNHLSRDNSRWRVERVSSRLRADPQPQVAFTRFKLLTLGALSTSCIKDAAL